MFRSNFLPLFALSLLALTLAGCVSASAQGRVRTVCTIDEVPPGMVVVGLDRSATQCPELTGLWVRPPGNPEAVCNFSPIPRGYIIASSNRLILCGRGHDAGYWIKLPGRNDVMCQDSRLPQGYVYVDYFYEPTCPGSGNDPNAYHISRTRN